MPGDKVPASSVEKYGWADAVEPYTTPQRAAELAAGYEAATASSALVEPPTPPAAPPAPTITVPTAGSQLTSGTVSVAGTSVPGQVSIYDGDAVVQSVTSSGSFSTTISLSPGTHSLSACVTVDGVESAWSTTVEISVSDQVTPPMDTVAVEDMTIAELRTVAETHQPPIDLTGLSRRDEILEAVTTGLHRSSV
jgi:hypothetical protein